MKPLAIVTICLNDRSGLDRTLASVSAQTMDAFEHIVVDGGSTDGSVELVRAYTGRPLRWVSEPDGGIYEAQNKGWRMATAPWVLFLNAGDALASPDVLGWVLPHLADGVDIVYGDLRLDRGAGELRTKHYPVRISSAWLMKESVPHPAQFTRRALLEQFGGFDTRYRIAADYAFFARAFWQGRAHTRHAGLVISTFDTRGLSSDPARKGRLAQERKAVQRRFAPRFWFVLYHAWAAFNRMVGR